MKSNLYQKGIHLIAVLMAALALCMPWRLVAQVQRPDSLSTQSTVTSQREEMRPRMMTSPLPVNIRQQGRQLCVQSRYNQLLPVYTEGGTFYTAFRLSKGTNWLSGLPKGTYLINNRKFTIY